MRRVDQSVTESALIVELDGEICTERRRDAVERAQGHPIKVAALRSGIHRLTHAGALGDLGLRVSEVVSNGAQDPPDVRCIHRASMPRAAHHALIRGLPAHCRVLFRRIGEATNRSRSYAPHR